MQVPYSLELTDNSTPTGTKLEISLLRVDETNFDMSKVRTSSIGVISPLSSLLQQMGKRIGHNQQEDEDQQDPGFVLNTQTEDGAVDGDVASAILDEFTLRATLKLNGDKLDLRVYQYGNVKPYIKIVDTYPNQLQQLYADIRFFPRRKGAFANLPVDGRRAYTWISANSGVAVYDRNFRISPYGMDSNDWLRIDADSARNRRDPRSSIAAKHFPMSLEERGATSENWMLRLPQSAQLVGLVSVEGRRISDVDPNKDEGLIASADREGFVENKAFLNLYDLIRGTVEAIAYVDRRIQQKQEQLYREYLLNSIREEAKIAISEIRDNPNISNLDKKRIIDSIAQTQIFAEEQEETTRERQRQLEIMSLLGVIAGFMTHEFGVALQELETAHTKLTEIGKRDPIFMLDAMEFAVHIANLKEFVTYASGYIRGTKKRPSKPYPAKPRIQQVSRIFGRYAKERNIDVVVDVENDVMAPFVPVSLYNGISLNLYTNALKSVTAKMGFNRGQIAFRAWNDKKWHYLEVLDTGIGIPSALEKRVFDPLFTTTQSQNDPLGSGMGLGLTLVKRSVESFGGRAEIVNPPPGFSTCVTNSTTSYGGVNQMSSTKSNLSILLVDDNSRYLQNLKFTLMDSLQQENVNIRAWNPKPKSDYLDLVGEFESFIDENTILVATDYDLTRSGIRGFFGDTVVGWCRRRFIPVGDFSRANATALTEKPDLFELRIPANNVEGARYIANVYRGFSTIRNALSKNAMSLGSKLSLSAVLAELLERPHLDSHFSLYMSRIVMNNSAIVEHVRPSTGHGNKGTPSKIQVVTYLLGHILINAILRYPGPILSERSLCAYLATSNSQAKNLKKLFSDAVYKGPFGEEGNYFWLEDIECNP